MRLLLRVGQYFAARGEYGAARSVEIRAVDKGRASLREEHPDTVTSMNNLAWTLYAQGDLAGARALEENSLEILRRVLGEELRTRSGRLGACLRRCPNSRIGTAP